MGLLTIPFIADAPINKSAPSVHRAARVGRAAAEGVFFSWVDRWAPERAGLEQFISGVFRDRYQAELHSFHDVLIGCKDASGEWTAALGFSALAHRAAFLEQYLERPVEQVVETSKPSPEGSRRVTRWDIAEVGNLTGAYCQNDRVFAPSAFPLGGVHSDKKPGQFFLQAPLRPCRACGC